MIVELCIHDKWEPHHVIYDSGTVTQTWCEGGRPIEIDYLAAARKLRSSVVAIATQYGGKDSDFGPFTLQAESIVDAALGGKQ